jgi:hypothetical protein
MECLIPQQAGWLQAPRRKAADQRATSWHLQEAEHCLEHKNLPAARFPLQQMAGGALPEPLSSKLNFMGRYLACSTAKHNRDYRNRGPDTAAGRASGFHYF